MKNIFEIVQPWKCIAKLMVKRWTNFHSIYDNLKRNWFRLQFEIQSHGTGREPFFPLDWFVYVFLSSLLLPMKEEKPNVLWFSIDLPFNVCQLYNIVYPRHVVAMTKYLNSWMVLSNFISMIQITNYSKLNRPGQYWITFSGFDFRNYCFELKLRGYGILWIGWNVNNGKYFSKMSIFLYHLISTMLRINEWIPWIKLGLKLMYFK